MPLLVALCVNMFVTSIKVMTVIYELARTERLQKYPIYSNIHLYKYHQQPVPTVQAY